MNLNSVYNKLEKFKEKLDMDILDEIMKEIETEIITNGKTNKDITNAWKRLKK